MEQINQFIQSLKPETLAKYAVTYGTAVFGALLIFVLGRLLAKALSRGAKRLLRKGKIDETLVSFIGNILFFVLLTLVVIASLEQLGVQTTSLTAILAAAGLAVGLSLQNSLSNFASGVLIITFRPFRAGDFVTVSGQSGTVEEVNIFNTQLSTPDNVRIIVPNSAITTSTIMNFSANKKRRIDLTFTVSYEDNLDKVKTVLHEIVSSEPRILQDPSPVIAVLALSDSGVNLVVRPWVKPEDYWDVYFLLQETVKRRFDTEGITIPIPQRHVYMHSA